MVDAVALCVHYEFICLIVIFHRLKARNIATFWELLGEIGGRGGGGGGATKRRSRMKKGVEK